MNTYYDQRQRTNIDQTMTARAHRSWSTDVLWFDYTVYCTLFPNFLDFWVSRYVRLPSGCPTHESHFHSNCPNLSRSRRFNSVLRPTTTSEYRVGLHLSWLEHSEGFQLRANWILNIQHSYNWATFPHNKYTSAPFLCRLLTVWYVEHSVSSRSEQ
jgi:hypothetical protein